MTISKSRLPTATVNSGGGGTPVNFVSYAQTPVVGYFVRRSLYYLNSPPIGFGRPLRRVTRSNRTMGSWGTGLYSGDFAADLRSTIGAVSQLPFDADRLVEILCETEPNAANDRDDADHTVFWLVLADQFAKRGLDCARVLDAALTIIDADQDIAMHEALGMTPSDLCKRRKTLTELRGKLISRPSTAKPRKTLKKPQPLLMEIGDLLVYPTCQGQIVNPYFREEDLERTGWNQDGWGAAMIIDRGRAFDFLAWYRPITVSDSLPEKPDVSRLQQCVNWELELPGTCSAAHYKKMQLEKLCNTTIDRGRVRESVGVLTPGIEAAVGDISIANRLSVGPYRGARYEIQIRSLAEIASASGQLSVYRPGNVKPIKDSDG